MTGSAEPFPLHRFEHEAMATTFVIHIQHADAVYARQAAFEAFRLCDHLESELSRFIESSSVSRINRAGIGEQVSVQADAYVCLRQALHLADASGGAFDVGYRSRKDQRLAAYAPPVRLSEEAVRVVPLRAAPDLDLGGIGKGYAIDRMGGLLAEWSITSALIAGGWSTLLAVGNPPGQAGWPVSLNGDASQQPCLPAGWSISASGFAVRAEHVQDPATGAKAGHAVRTWAVARSAAVSDALSTAFLAMPPEALRAFADAWPECGAVIEHFDHSLEFAGIRLPLLN